MTTDENYKESVDLWTKGQEKSIEVLKLNIDFIKNEIKLKQQQLKIFEDSLVHEEKFLKEYLETVK